MSCYCEARLVTILGLRVHINLQGKTGQLFFWQYFMNSWSRFSIMNLLRRHLLTFKHRTLLSNPYLIFQNNFRSLRVKDELWFTPDPPTSFTIIPFKTIRLFLTLGRYIKHYVDRWRYIIWYLIFEHFQTFLITNTAKRLLRYLKLILINTKFKIIIKSFPGWFSPCKLPPVSVPSAIQVWTFHRPEKQSFD